VLTIALAVSVLAFAGAAVLRIGRRPFRHKDVYPSKIGHFLDVLIRRGYDGGTLVFELREPLPTRRFIQFRKYIRAPGIYGVEFGHPDAAWAAPYRGVLLEGLRENGFYAREVPTGEATVPAFVIVDVGSSIEDGVRLVEYVIEAVFNKPTSIRVDALMSGVSVNDEVIDTK
jgi:hypothetical protein